MNFDTFDALRAGEPTVVEVLGRTHSRLLRWSGAEPAGLEGDLAERWEMPEPGKLVFHLSPRARWHDRPPVHGRSLVVSDVLSHFERLRALAGAGGLPLSQRASDYALVSRVTAPDSSTVVVETSAPDPFLVATLAGRFAFIQAPEAVEAFADRWQERDPASVVGTGPFVLSAVRDDGALVFEANGSGHISPLLDGIEVSNPFSLPGRFLDGELDEVLLRDRRDAARVRDRLGSAVLERHRFEDSPVVSSFFVGGAPWNNPVLRQALSAGLNRGELGKRLFGGRAAPAGPVAPVFPGFVLPDSALGQFPGYRAGLADDQKDGRALWQAGGGPALGPVIIDFPSVFDPLYSASSIVCGLLNESLGVAQFRPAVESYTTIATKATGRRYGNGTAALWFGWGPPFAERDPARWLIETYRSGGPGAAATGFAHPGVDRALAGLAAEFDATRRASAILEVQRLLLESGGGGVIDWLVQQSSLFRWPFLGRQAAPLPFPEQHLDHASFLDPAAEGYSRRATAD